MQRIEAFDRQLSELTSLPALLLCGLAVVPVTPITAVLYRPAPLVS